MNHIKKFAPYLTALFLLVVGYLLYQSLLSINWPQVQASVTKFSWVIVLPALALVALDFLILTSYDYLGFRYFQINQMNYLKVLPSAFCCYAFNLNLGAMVGGLGFRFRIYSGWGVKAAEIPKIVLLSTITNWLGHALLISLIFCFWPQDIERLIGIPAWILVLIGTIQFAAVLSYFYFCLIRKVMTIKGHTFTFPKISWAFIQLLLSTTQWLLLSAIIYLLLAHLGHQVDLGQIIFTSLIASVAGVFTHIPGGLGVLEAIFLKVNLGVPAADMLAALICYRVVYYLIPLMSAIPCYLGIEYYQKRVFKFTPTGGSKPRHN